MMLATVDTIPTEFAGMYEMYQFANENDGKLIQQHDTLIITLPKINRKAFYSVSMRSFKTQPFIRTSIGYHDQYS